MAVVSAGLPLASIARAEPAGTSSRGNKPSVEQVCTTPQPGKVGCLALRRNDVGGRQGVLPATVTPSGYGAADLQSAYNLPSDGGEGRTVAVVVAYDDPTAESDLAVYRAQYGLPECTTANGCFRKIDQRGGSDYPEPHAGWAGEASLDLDMVSAAAPGAHILLVEADSNTFEDIFTAVDQAVAQGAQYVSNSYGSEYDSTPGSGEDPAETAEFDAHYNHPGVAMVASSGDFGYGVTYPAASQYVTAAGGTALKKDDTTRGWSESVWHNGYGGTGSGCSAYEPKPAFQSDTGCDMRSVADVAAVADPLTGVAVYQTYGSSGWGVMGGTSASAPIIAGAYAAAGAPAKDSYPNSYPYFKPSALNDVTSGANGTCTTSYLCTARLGYDGPTGLGTPNGTAAFRSYPHGKVSGTVTGTAGAPLARATITAGDYQATTDADGHYSLTLPPGSYDLTAAAYGYRSRTTTAVDVTDGGSVTESFALDAAAGQTVTGKVTDGSGHGWPLYATVTVDGVPGAPVFTDPYTGTYELQLPEDHDYTLKVAARYPGYQTVTRNVTVGTSAKTVDIAVPVDAEAATAAGYKLQITGSTEPFDSTTAPPAGWSVVNADNTAGGWEFSDPGHRYNRTGGSGGFAIVDSDHIGAGEHQDSSLLSPVYDFSDYTRPRISFDTNYVSYNGQSAAVDITTDGGATWTTVRTWNTPLGGHVEIPLTDYAGAKAVQLRFRFVATWGYWWELDNIFVGNRPYVPVTGGLVAGTVTDANTGDGVVGATVTNADATAQSAVTAATPDDPKLADGFYWLFSDTVGSHSFTVAKRRYASGDKSVRVAADSITEAGQALEAGQLTITPATVDKTLPWDGTGTQKLTVKNTGGAPATFTLREQSGGFQTQAAQGAPLQLVPGDYSPLQEQADKSGTEPARSAVAPAAAGDAWKPVADLPVAVSSNAVAAGGGKLYSAFGWTGSADTSDLYAYDPDSGSWSKLASAADTREAPAEGFIDGKLYAVGGWGADGSPDAKLEIYDPSSDTWTTGAPSPKPYAASGSAVLDDQLYVVGGCTASSCNTTDVYAYDPSTDSWSEMAPYPEPISWTACGAINGMLYCAGGTADSGSTQHGYAYDPESDSWSPIADLPTTLWGSASTAANGLLLTIGGRTPGGITNQGFAFDPQAGTWTALPNAGAPVYRGGGAPGFYTVGGKSSNAIGSPSVATVEVLPGYDQVDGSADVTWLGFDTRQATLAPGASTTVEVSLDATVAEITQPGAYTAKLSVRTDTPYRVPAIPVTMHVNPPKHWGKYAGTVLGADGAGGTAPLAGATVRLDAKTSSHTLTTAEDGTFALWLDARDAPLTVTVTKDGYQPATAKVKIEKGETTIGDFTLKKAP
ncbi:carboxypeptidase regulatory-like domain-containing protein [Streptomyces sp. NPDC002088]|uniref:carboxypeptidase regulatory-like domain-containing protein n=1 Tax=Streptomyces sp. NPDC002088 TaxID=3154665 RepID=UPI003333E87A